MTEGKASTPKKFCKAANQFGFTFNWALRVPQGHGVSSPPASCRSAPAASTAACPRWAPGNYEWRGFLSEHQHPHDISGPERPAAQLEQPLGAGLHARRRRALRLGAARGAVRQVAGPAALPDVVERHEPGRHRGRAARRVAVVSRVLRGAPAPERADQQVVDILDDWVARDAPRLDADDDGHYDEPGPAIMDARLDADRGDRDASGLRRPARRPDDVRSLGRPGRPVLRGQGPAHAARPARCGASSTSATAARASSRPAGRRCGRRSTTSRHRLWPSRLGPDPTKWLTDGGDAPASPRA